MVFQAAERRRNQQTPSWPQQGSQAGSRFQVAEFPRWLFTRTIGGVVAPDVLDHGDCEDQVESARPEGKRQGVAGNAGNAGLWRRSQVQTHQEGNLQSVTRLPVAGLGSGITNI